MKAWTFLWMFGRAHETHLRRPLKHPANAGLKGPALAASDSPRPACRSNQRRSLRLLEPKQELIGVTSDRRIEYFFRVIVVLVRKN